MLARGRKEVDGVGGVRMMRGRATIRLIVLSVVGRVLLRVMTRVVVIVRGTI